jgi:hypothetical protein
VKPPAIEVQGAHRDPKLSVQRLLMVADAAVADVDELPPPVRDLVAAAAKMATRPGE